MYYLFIFFLIPLKVPHFHISHKKKTINRKSWYFLQMEVFKKFQIGYSNLLFRMPFYGK
jgi:hypothetical protein